MALRARSPPPPLQGPLLHFILYTSSFKPQYKDIITMLLVFSRLLRFFLPQTSPKATSEHNISGGGGGGGGGEACPQTPPQGYLIQIFLLGREEVQNRRNDTHCVLYCVLFFFFFFFFFFWGGGGGGGEGGYY